MAWLLACAQVLAEVGSRLVGISARPAVAAFHLAAAVALAATLAAVLAAGEPRRVAGRWSVLRLVVVALVSGGLVVARASVGLAEPTVSYLAPALLVAPAVLGWDLVDRWQRGSRPRGPSLRRMATVWCGLSAVGLVVVAVGPERWEQVDLRTAEGRALGVGIVLVGLCGVLVTEARWRLSFAVAVLGGAIAVGATAPSAGLAVGPMLVAAAVVASAVASFVPAVRRWVASVRRAAEAGGGVVGARLVSVGSWTGRGWGGASSWVARRWSTVLDVARPRVLTPRPSLTSVDRLAAAAMAVASLAYVASGWWWARRVGWQPTGHSATVMARSMDVGTADHPYVGMITSLGPSSVASHPGPVLFDILSPLVRVFGTQEGAFAGAALLAVVSWLAVVWSAWRAAGRWAAVLSWVTGAAVVSVAALGIVWDANNVSITMLATFGAVTASWAAATGSWRAWWVAVALASLAMQGYLPHGVIALGPVLWSGLALLGARRVGDDEGRRAGRALWGGVVVGMVLWLQPVLDVVLNSGGNVADLAGSVADPQPSVGGRGIPVAVGWVFSVPPRWSSISQSFAQAGSADELLGGVAIVGLIVAVGVVVGWWWSADRAGEPERQLRILVAWVVAGAAVNVTQLPSSFLHSFQLGWLVVASMCVWFAVLYSVGLGVHRWLATRGGAPALRAAQVGTLAVGVVAVLAMGASRTDQVTDLKGAEFTIDAMVDPVVAQTVGAPEVSEVSGPLLVLGLDTQLNQVAMDTILSNLIVEGLDVRVPTDIVHYGERRQVGSWDGPQLWITNGLGPVEPDGLRVAAATEPGWTRAAFDEAAAELARELGDEPVVLQPWALQSLPRYLAGWVEGDVCGLARDLRDQTASAADLPAGLLLVLYGDDGVRSPALDPQAQAEARALVGQAPLEVWLVGPTDGGELDSDRLLRDGSSCEEWISGS